MIGATIKGASTVTVCARQVAGVPARLDRRANPLAGEPDEAHDLVAHYRNLDDPTRADELEGRLNVYSRFGSDLDGGTTDAADLEQPTFPPRDRDEEHGELPELPHPRLLRGVVATRAGSGLPRAEVLLFRAEAEDEEHRASVVRRAVPPAAGAPRRQEVVTLQVGMPLSTPSTSSRRKPNPALLIRRRNATVVMSCIRGYSRRSR